MSRELNDEIRERSTEIQTSFIMDLICLCEEYGISKTRFIRDTVHLLDRFVSEINLDELNPESDTGFMSN